MGQRQCHQRHKDQQQQKQKANLADPQRLPPLAAYQKEQHGKVCCANEHQDNGDNLNGKAVVFPNAVQPGGKSTGGKAAHGMADAFKQGHTGNGVGCGSDQQKDEIHGKDGLRRFPQVRHQLVRVTFGVEQIHGTLVGEQHHDHHNEAKAAAILHKTPVKQENMGGLGHIHNGKTCGGPTADGFKKCLHKIQVSGKHKGHCANQNPPEPGEQNRVAALPLGHRPGGAGSVIPSPKQAHKRAN